MDGGEPADEAADVGLDRLDTIGDHQCHVVPWVQARPGEGVGESGGVGQHLPVRADLPVCSESDVVATSAERVGEQCPGGLIHRRAGSSRRWCSKTLCSADRSRRGSHRAVDV